MRTFRPISCVLVLFALTTVNAGYVTAEPVDDQQSALPRNQTNHQNIIADARPRLAGLRSRNLELLQDALRRKFTTKAPTDALARQHILRMAQNRAGLNVLNGAMAE